MATDAKLTHEEVIRMATVSHDGFARAIRPVHMSEDGDTIFSVSAEKIEIYEHRQQLMDILNEAACECLSKAIKRSVSRF